MTRLDMTRVNLYDTILVMVKSKRKKMRLHFTSKFQRKQGEHTGGGRLACVSSERQCQSYLYCLNHTLPIENTFVFLSLLLR